MAVGEPAVKIFPREKNAEALEIQREKPETFHVIGGFFLGQFRKTTAHFFGETNGRWDDTLICTKVSGMQFFLVDIFGQMRLI